MRLAGVYLADFRRFNFPDYDTLVFGDLLSLLRGFPLSLVPFQLIKPPNVQETHLRSKKILVSKQHCCRMHNYMRATDLSHIALVYTYKQPRLNKPITKFSFMRSLGMYFIVHSVPIQPTSNYYSIFLLFFISKEVWVLGGFLFTPESY
jgi:hypothetical protein